MKIISSTTVKQAATETKNAKYSIEYSIMDNNLSRVIASIYGLQKDKNENDIYVGTISLENGIINSSLPVNSKASLYISDFENILSVINELEFDTK